MPFALTWSVQMFASIFIVQLSCPHWCTILLIIITLYKNTSCFFLHIFDQGSVKKNGYWVTDTNRQSTNIFPFSMVRSGSDDFETPNSWFLLKHRAPGPHQRGIQVRQSDWDLTSRWLPERFLTEMFVYGRDKQTSNIREVSVWKYDKNRECFGAHMCVYLTGLG